jgi:capsular polysaccharide biosynthesis protein
VDHARASRLGDRDGIVGGCVIDDDGLAAERLDLGQHRLERQPQIRRPVPHRHDHGNRDARRHGERRIGGPATVAASSPHPGGVYTRRTVELRRHLAVLRRRLLLILLSIAVGLGVAYATTSRTSVYSARVRIYVGSKAVLQGTVSNDLLAGLERIIRTYALMIDSEPIAQEALKRVPDIKLSPEALVAATTAFGEPQTQLLTVRVASTDPQDAQALANAVSTVFIDKIKDFDPAAPPQEGQPPQQPAYIFEPARLPVVPAASELPRRLVLGFLFGLFLSSGVAFLVEYLDITVKSAVDAERRLELPVLGVIPMERQRPLAPVQSEATLGTV